MDDALIDFRMTLQAAAERRLTPRRRHRRTARIALVAVALASVLSGAALGATSLLGDPAPPEVVHDFGTYTPQLGFTPIPGKAVHVPQNGGVGLFATGNQQGTYCITVTAPWKTSSEQDDGGTCVRAPIAAAPFVAGIVGGQNGAVVLAGRVTTPRAATVALMDGRGALVRAPIGENGFFVALVADNDHCALGDWAPTMRAEDATGATVTSATFSLLTSPTMDVCGGAFGLQLPAS